MGQFTGGPSAPGKEEAAAAAAERSFKGIRSSKGLVLGRMLVFFMKEGWEGWGATSEPGASYCETNQSLRLPCSSAYLFFFPARLATRLAVPRQAVNQRQRQRHRETDTGTETEVEVERSRREKERSPLRCKSGREASGLPPWRRRKRRRRTSSILSQNTLVKTVHPWRPGHATAESLRMQQLPTPNRL